MIRYGHALASVLCLTAAAALAQHVEVPDWENSVRFELITSQDPVRPGDELEVAVLAEIDPGYHLYGPRERKPSRTQVAVLSGQALAAGEPTFPPVVTRDLSGLGKFDLYEGRIAIRIPISVAGDASEGDVVPVDVRINYQVCTDVACSAPTNKTLSLQLAVAGKGDAVEKRHRDVFDSKE